MPRAKKTNEEVEKKDVVVVTLTNSTREFSREIHGDDFEKIAATFAETNGGTVA